MLLGQCRGGKNCGKEEDGGMLNSGKCQFVISLGGIERCQPFLGSPLFQILSKKDLQE
jgi:hypothetical protein